MIRAVIYARFSTDHQSAKSIEDQVRACEQHAQGRGYTIVGVFKDEARSGTTVLGREGLEGLLHAAKHNAFDMVVVESLDRLSRDGGDLYQMHKALAFSNIPIDCVHHGLVDGIQVGVHAIYGTVFIENVRTQVRRGMTGLVYAGLHPGGKAYGFAPMPKKRAVSSSLSTRQSSSGGFLRPMLTV